MSSAGGAGYCRGCGSVIQTTDPKKPGYVPAEVNEAKKGKNIVCQRCYRITNYGESGTVQPQVEQIKQAIVKGIQQSELLALVVDYADLAGTLPVWAGFLNDTPYILIVNKADLLPERTQPAEVKAYIEHYVSGHFSEKPRAVALTSSIRKNGLAALADQLRAITVSGSKITLLGATNVGKSSLIKGFLMSERSKVVPTVSKYPGTTMGLSNWSIFNSRNTLIDTPGLVTGDRAGDLLCPQCAGQLVSSVKIGQKLWGVKAGQGVILGGLFGLESLTAEESVMIAFAAPNLSQHRTANARVLPLLEEGADWLAPFCTACHARWKWHETEVDLEPHQDIAVAGLGWISIRGKGGRYKVVLPEGLRWEIRPALVGKR